MKKELITLHEDSKDFRLIKRIHEESFQVTEYPELKELVKYPDSYFYGAFLDGVPVGTVYLLIGHDFVYLIYISIEKSRRRQGIGIWMLEEVKKKYHNHIIVVDMPLDEGKETGSVDKKDFYLKNGFIATGYQLKYETTGEISNVYSTGNISEKLLNNLINIANGTSDKNRIFLVDRKDINNA